MAKQPVRAGTREWWVHSPFGFLAGLAACAVVFVADTLVDTQVLIALLVVAPLICCGSASPARTAVVGSVAVVLAVVLGWVDDIEWTPRHWVHIATVGLGGVLAVWLAHVRTQRERELRSVSPERERAEKLAWALHAGRVGSWSWDMASGTVVWDTQLEELFGLRHGEFGGTFDEWANRLDPRDTRMVLEKVEEMVRTRQAVRFDHRVVWPDGSIHWLEGVGEAVTRRGEVVGGFGLSIDIDERVRQVEERNRLLTREQLARERSEYLSRVNAAVGETLSVDEILAKVTAAVVPDFADWCSLLVAIDRPRRKPLIVYAHADPAEMERGEELLRAHPYDPDAPFGAALTMKTGKTEFIQDLDPALLTGEAHALAPFAIRSAITAPLRGSLGVLGTVQLIRTGERVFDHDDLELAGELAARIGSALNNAVVYARQLRTEALLETLQHVTGQVNAVSTRADIRALVTQLDWSKIQIDGAHLYLYDEDGDLLTVDSSSGEAPAAATFEELVSDQSPPTRGHLVLPLVMMNRKLGVITLQFDPERNLTMEERATFDTIAERFAGAIERSRIYEGARDNALMLQRRLMPTIPALPDWLEVAADYLPTPGGEVGGDWFQVIDAPGERIVAVVGDAVGHGLASAAAMGQLRGAIAGAVASDTDPDRVLAATERFAMTVIDMMYATVAYVLLDTGPVIRYACAGHLPPAWVRPGQRARLIDGGRRPLLGAGSPHAMPVSASADFARGDTIVLYTDGLVERRREPIDLGFDRLLAVLEELATAPVQEVCNQLVERLTPGRDIEDDIALLVLRRV